MISWSAFFACHFMFISLCLKLWSELSNGNSATRVTPAGLSDRGMDSQLCNILCTRVEGPRWAPSPIISVITPLIGLQPSYPYPFIRPFIGVIAPFRTIVAHLAIYFQFQYISSSILSIFGAWIMLVGFHRFRLFFSNESDLIAVSIDLKYFRITKC